MMSCSLRFVDGPLTPIDNVQLVLRDSSIRSRLLPFGGRAFPVASPRARYGLESETFSLDIETVLLALRSSFSPTIDVVRCTLIICSLCEQWQCGFYKANSFKRT